MPPSPPTAPPPPSPAGSNPYAPPPYPQYSGPGFGYGYAPRATNGLAVASLVLGIIGWALCGVGSILAIVFGAMARSQIRSSGGRETGDGMALAGIILGSIGVALVIAYVAAALAAGFNS
jgi:hypothetical protein